MKTLTLTLICLFGLAVGLTTIVRADDPKKDEPKKDAKEVAVIKTSAGEMVIELWPDVAPKTVENFKTLAKKGFYDGTAFHRIIKGFMIQGGDPNTKDLKAESSYGGGDPGYSIPDEFNDRSHERGVISMANTGRPHSAGCQFFICLSGDYTGVLDHHYTAFGKVIKGDDVLGKLGDAEVVQNQYHPEPAPSKPVKRQSVESIKIVPADSIK